MIVETYLGREDIKTDYKNKYYKEEKLTPLIKNLLLGASVLPRTESDYCCAKVSGSQQLCAQPVAYSVSRLSACHCALRVIARFACLHALRVIARSVYY